MLQKGPRKYLKYFSSLMTLSFLQMYHHTKSSSVGFYKYTNLRTISAKDFMYLYKLFSFGGKDSNMRSEQNRKHNSVVLHTLCPSVSVSVSLSVSLNM